jgi:nucleoside-diphosphate-sugar epimerase
MKLVVTGANGFIGRHLCKRLQLGKYDFHCLIRPESSRSFFDKNNIPVIEADGNVKFLASLLKAKNINPLVLSNILFGTQLLDASVKADIKWFLNTGTFWQHYNGSIYDPVNLYAATKQAFEDIGRYYANAYNLRFCTLKLCDTYGPNDKRNKIFNLWEKIAKSGEVLNMSPGDQLIDIVHVDQVVDAYLRLIISLNSESNKENCESYYVSSNRKISLRELAMEYEQTHHVKLNINWGGRNYRKREVMVPACIGYQIDNLSTIKNKLTK